jgi:tetratricopeptide (TPR) repeat protein
LKAPRLILIFLALVASASRAQDAGRVASAIDLRLAEVATAVQKAHEGADQMAKSEPSAAAEALSRALELDFPSAPQSRSLRLDLFARIAELFLAGKEPRRALEAANQGLREATKTAPDALTAQLHLRAGEAREALGDDHGAMEDFGQAIAIAKRLLAPRNTP